MNDIHFQMLDYYVSWHEFSQVYPTCGCSAYWICRLMPCAKFGKFSAINYSNSFSAPRPLPLLSDMYIRSSVIAPQDIYFSLFPLCCWDWIVLFCIQVHWLFCHLFSLLSYSVSILFSSSWISVLSSFVSSIYLLKLSIFFHLLKVCSELLNFVITTLPFLTDHSKIFVLLVLMYTLMVLFFFFFFSFEWIFSWFSHVWSVIFYCILDII